MLISFEKNFSGQSDSVNQLNTLFMSKQLADLKLFFEKFTSTEELVGWMKHRPKFKPEIKDIQGNNDIVVVIVTPYFESALTKRCILEIFNGLRIILVGGEGPGNLYFNAAHYFNEGVAYALKYDPKWIVISSDDMVPIDNVSVLYESLKSLDNEKYDAVFTEPSKYHSIPNQLSKANFLRKTLFSLLCDRRFQLTIERKFNLNYFPVPQIGIIPFFYNRGFFYNSIASFGIFSTNFVREMKGVPFDETYPIGGWDDDISIQLSYEKRSCTMIHYRINELRGTSLGNDATRKLRDLVGLIYLNVKWSQKIFEDSQKLPPKPFFYDLMI